MGKKGIDVSTWQGNIDWEKVKADGVQFAILRCGFGSDIQSQDDNKWERNVSECERLGIKYGAYLYSYAQNMEEAKSEVQHTLRLMKGHNPIYGVWLDVEDGSQWNIDNKTLADFCVTFCDAMKEAGYKTGIYASLNWFDNKLNDSRLAKYDKWLAQWQVKEPQLDCAIWQYTSDGEVNGISGRVDMNIAYKEYVEEEEEEVKPVPAPTPTTSNVNVYYKVRTKQSGWLPEVKNLEDYAGLPGQAITDVAIKVDKGSVKYRVFVDGRWLPYVTGYNINDYNNGYAGNGNPINCIEVYYTTPSNVKPLKEANYRVAPVGGNYYSWQEDNSTKGGMDGYAGTYYTNIDKFQIEIKDC